MDSGCLGSGEVFSVYFCPSELGIFNLYVYLYQSKITVNVDIFALLSFRASSPM